MQSPIFNPDTDAILSPLYEAKTPDHNAAYDDTDIQRSCSPEYEGPASDFVQKIRTRKRIYGEEYKISTYLDINPVVEPKILKIDQPIFEMHSNTSYRNDDGPIIPVIIQEQQLQQQKLLLAANADENCIDNDYDYDDQDAGGMNANNITTSHKNQNDSINNNDGNKHINIANITATVACPHDDDDMMDMDENEVVLVHNKKNTNDYERCNDDANDDEDDDDDDDDDNDVDDGMNVFHSISTPIPTITKRPFINITIEKIHIPSICKMCFALSSQCVCNIIKNKTI